MNNSVNQNEQILDQVKKMMLEQQVSELGNSLSNTISFFSMVLAIGAIFFAVLIVVISWWLNRLFNEKLKNVEVIETRVKSDLREIKQIKRENDKKFSESQDMYNDIQNSKQKLDIMLEENKRFRIWNEYLEEKIKIVEKRADFMELAHEIEEKIKKVTRDDIVKFYTDLAEGEPEEQFNFQMNYYLEAREAFLSLNNNSYECYDFEEDKNQDEDTVAFPSDEIRHNYAEAKGFLEELNQILKST
ncbi:TPA: hypothetical protein ROY01_004800 [Bacillus toyonensis]|nr:hypothetical protein [Bacillus toyonensis]